MLRLEDKETAEFVFDSILKVSPTERAPGSDTRYIKDDEIISLDGVYPYLSATSSNNGIKGYSKIEPTNEPGVVTLSTTADSSETTFYQPVNFIGRQQISKISHYDYSPLSEGEGLFIATVMRKITKQFGYGYKLTNSYINSSILTLPVTSTGEPDWEWMEAYIRQIEELHVTRLKFHNDREAAILRELHPVDDATETGEPEELDLENKETAEFRVGDLFDFYKGKRITKQDQIPGDTPYVTAVSTGNGIDSWIDNPEFTMKNIITMNFFGDCFYHPYEVAFKDGTYGLEIKDEDHRSPSHYIYFMTVIEKQGKQRGSYSKMLTDSIAAEMKIPVPATPTGEPDWEWMDAYIRQIEERERELIDAYLTAKRKQS